MSNLGFEDGEEEIIQGERRRGRGNVKHGGVDVEIALLLDRVQLLEYDFQLLKKQFEELKTVRARHHVFPDGSLCELQRGKWKRVR